MASSIAVPLVNKAKPIGALNVLSRERDRYSERDAEVLRLFAAHVATALVNARLFEQQRQDAEAFELMAEIGREVASVLDLDALLSRIAQLAKRVIDYRTFGILLLNEETKELEMKVAVRYGEESVLPTVPLGEGLVGYAALHCEPVLVPDVSQDPRYIKVMEDVRSKLAIPMLAKEKCIGVFDLESPELDAFTKRDVEILTLLAAQAAVAIENARSMKRCRPTKRAWRRSCVSRSGAGGAAAIGDAEAAQARTPPRRSRRREPRRRFSRLLTPESNTLIAAVGDVGERRARRAYSVFAGELVRAAPAPLHARATSPGAVLMSINTILHERQLEEYYCTLCYAIFDLKRRQVTLANSGLPYPVRATAEGCELIEVPGVPLGSFFGVTYDEVTFPLARGDVYVFCSDGVSEAMNSRQEEFGSNRLLEVVSKSRQLTAREIVHAITEAVAEHRAGFAPNDDTTVVVVRMGDLA
jgi:sigma-B regulation protein RsbU (phosphoserine phosphatase)